MVISINIHGFLSGICSFGFIDALTSRLRDQSRLSARLCSGKKWVIQVKSKKWSQAKLIENVPVNVQLIYLF
ncbi:hypothetical protein L596_019677 [Steinernema carpocapsae]|uniref:Uncharacterized protein n=1 Tax=Steinernema carpocapsae TaxID=34508 RepID=A0A4U5MR91_STECR|nr:hypothetical protein L596_019677 [Steinernema carpocapsae]